MGKKHHRLFHTNQNLAEPNKHSPTYSTPKLISHSLKQKPHGLVYNLFHSIYLHINWKIMFSVFCFCLILFTFSERSKQTNVIMNKWTKLYQTSELETSRISLFDQSEIKTNLLDSSSLNQEEINYHLPTVFIGILVRNKAYSLPYFLKGLEIQSYPKNRIKLCIYLDNTIDESEFILDEWVNLMKHNYHNIQYVHDTDTDRNVMNTPMWSPNHYLHLIKLRQNLLDNARLSWADFYFSIDADIILLNQNTIKHLVNQMLIHKNLTIIAPLLNCTNSEYYANFWGAMNEFGYYKRSDNYFDIQTRRIQGLIPVAMVHSIMMINMRKNVTDVIGYREIETVNYTGPIDDMIIFARSTQKVNLQFYLDNTQFYGYFTSPIEEENLQGDEDYLTKWLNREKDLFAHLRLQAVIDLEDTQRVLPSESLQMMAENLLPTKSKIGFDEIYCINLIRRPDRKAKMAYIFDQLGIDVKWFIGVDGKQLNQDKIDKLGIKQLPGYNDPYHKRPLKYGEIGCFLSHFYLWKELIERGYRRVMILEDDLRFEPGFVTNLKRTIQEADMHVPHWDILYIGRKRMSKNESHVPNSSMLVYPNYTYWTLGYVLNHSGAAKLLNQKPLSKMVAVDEYIPIMYDKHPHKEWLKQFMPRNLIALSAEPLLIEPQRYTGEKFYVSDTEDSDVIQMNRQ